MLSKIKNTTIYCVVLELTKRYFRHGISRTGAELAYFFLFSLFPLVMFVTSLIGKLNIDISEAFSSVEHVVPHDILQLIDDYTSYLTSIQSEGLMYTGIVLTIYFFSRALNALHFALNRAYAVKERRNVFIQLLISIMFTIILMIVIIVTLVLLVSGKTVIETISEFLNIKVYYINIWNILRFIIAGGCFLFSLALMYIVLPNKRIKLKQAMPGALTAMSAWLAVSLVFSYYVENMGRYSFLYGSIGAIMVLMLWLYLTSIILVMGAELNSSIESYKESVKEVKD